MHQIYYSRCKAILTRSFQLHFHFARVLGGSSLARRRYESDIPLRARPSEPRWLVEPTTKGSRPQDLELWTLEIKELYTWRRNVSRLKAKYLCVQCSSIPIILSSPVRHVASYLIPKHRRPAASFPKVRPHAPNTVQTPPRNKLPLIGRIKQTLWAIGSRLVESDAKYAFKVGMATAIMAAPAFFDATRPIFVDYWGDWALISVRQIFQPFLIYSPSEHNFTVLFCDFTHHRSY